MCPWRAEIYAVAVENEHNYQRPKSGGAEEEEEDEVAD